MTIKLQTNLKNQRKVKIFHILYMMTKRIMMINMNNMMKIKKSIMIKIMLKKKKKITRRIITS